MEGHRRRRMGYGNRMWMGPPGPGWAEGRRRLRRGDVRRAVLVALEAGPAHGYEIMRRLEERTGGAWRPSPGSIYPTLQMLEDEGLVKGEDRDGSRVYELTDAGRQERERAVGETPPGGAPWDRDDEDFRLHTLRDSLGQVLMASKQVAQAGAPGQVDRAIEILQRARKELYQTLAEA
jgi:DNA-binding PadR family transcriptional regulator